MYWIIEQFSVVWNLTGTDVKFCTWDGVWSAKILDLEKKCLEKSPAERVLQKGGWQQLSRSQQCAVAARRANPMLGCIKHSINSCQKSRLSLCIQCWCSTTLSMVCSSGPHNLRRMWRYLSVSRGGQQSWQQGWRACPERSSWGLWVKLVWRKGQPCSPQLLRRGSGERGTDFLCLVTSDGMLGKSSKLHQENFRLDIRKYFFTKSATKQRNSLPRIW